MIKTTHIQPVVDLLENEINAGELATILDELSYEYTYLSLLNVDQAFKGALDKFHVIRQLRDAFQKCTRDAAGTNAVQTDS